jgi:metallo-beta-lactamase class B
MEASLTLHHKHKAGDAYNPAVFIDRKGYDESLKKLTDAFAAQPK